MRDAPGGAELLWQARAVLLEDLLGRIPEDKRYDGLMIAAAMATAARELEAGAAPLERAYAGLAEAAGEPAAAPAEGADLRAALLALERRLAEAIRRGARDGDGRLHAALRTAAVERVALSNPKALKGRE